MPTHQPEKKFCLPFRQSSAFLVQGSCIPILVLGHNLPGILLIRQVRIKSDLPNGKFTSPIELELTFLNIEGDTKESRHSLFNNLLTSFPSPQKNREERLFRIFLRAGGGCSQAVTPGIYFISMACSLLSLHFVFQ